MFDLTPLRSQGFRHLAAACWVNEFGNWIGEIALAILVWDRTGSPLATATLFLSLRFLPAMLAPLLTTKTEVFPPRVVISALYTVEAALFVALAAMVSRFSLPRVLVLAGCDGLFAITATALVRSTLVTELSENSLLREGNALVNLGTMLAIAGAPITAGLLAGSNGAASALRVDAATFAVAALIIATARGIRVTSDTSSSFSTRLRAGLGVLSQRPMVRRLLIAISLVVTLGSVALPVEVVFAENTLHAGDSGYGVLLTAWGTGMIIGGLVFAATPWMRLMNVLGLSVSLIAVGYGGLAVSPDLAIACIASFVGGTGNSAAWVAARTALQARIPLTAQSAVMAVLEGSNQTMPALGFVVGGAVTAISSPRIAYAVSAVGVAAVLALFSVWRLNEVHLRDPSERQETQQAPSHPPGMQEARSASRNPSVPTLTTR